MPKYIADDIEISSHDPDIEDSDDESSNEKILTKKFLMKKTKYRMCLVFIFFDVSKEKNYT